MDKPTLKLRKKLGDDFTATCVASGCLSGGAVAGMQVFMGVTQKGSGFVPLLGVTLAAILSVAISSSFFRKLGFVAIIAVYNPIAPIIDMTLWKWVVAWVVVSVFSGYCFHREMCEMPIDDSWIDRETGVGIEGEE